MAVRHKFYDDGDVALRGGELDETQAKAALVDDGSLWCTDFEEDSGLGEKQKVYDDGSVKIVGELDEYGSFAGMVAGYATHRTTYCKSDYIMKVRRVTAADEVDVYDCQAGTNNYKLTADGGWVDGTAETFYVVILYDQSGNEVDLEQSTAADQPGLSFNETTDGYPALVFDGTSDYMHQMIYDTHQGAVTYNGNNLDDDGQDFNDWKTTAGDAAYMIVVTDDDAHISWGYLGNVVDATEIIVYTDLALTSAGWKGDGGTGTPATYEILKTDFQIIGDMTALLWVKPDDGHPGDTNYFIGRMQPLSAFTFILATDGDVYTYLYKTNTAYSYSCSDDPFFSDGVQTTFSQIGFTHNTAGPTVILYGNGAVIPSSSGSGEGGATSIQDVYVPLRIGSSEPAKLFTGQIASVVIFSTALLSTKVYEIYDYGS